MGWFDDITDTLTDVADTVIDANPWAQEAFDGGSLWDTLETTISDTAGLDLGGISDSLGGFFDGDLGQAAWDALGGAAGGLLTDVADDTFGGGWFSEITDTVQETAGEWFGSDFELPGLDDLDYTNCWGTIGQTITDTVDPWIDDLGIPELIDEAGGWIDDQFVLPDDLVDIVCGGESGSWGTLLGDPEGTLEDVGKLIEETLGGDGPAAGEWVTGEVGEPFFVPAVDPPIGVEDFIDVDNPTTGIGVDDLIDIDDPTVVDVDDLGLDDDVLGTVTAAVEPMDDDPMADAQDLSEVESVDVAADAIYDEQPADYVEAPAEAYVPEPEPEPTEFDVAVESAEAIDTASDDLFQDL
jgi:hypothetical protein